MEYKDIAEIDSATNLDRALVTSIVITAAFSILTVIVFVLYLTGGFLLLQTGSGTLPYQFLSLDSDPVFNTLTTVSGIVIGTMCMVLVLFALVSQKNEDTDSIVLFFALIGIGFAAGLVRMSLGVTLRFFGQLLP